MSFFNIIVLVFSGFGAGLITGVIGASAVAFIAGILMVVLNYPAYISIGIGLITDFFTSTVSTYNYWKNGNIDLKKGFLIGILTIVFAFIGSFFSRKIPNSTLGNSFGIIILLVGLNFLVGHKKKTEINTFAFFKNRPLFTSILVGVVVGLISGVLGVGGGLTILFILYLVFHFSIKKAVGTSVLIMAFMSLAGGVGHFISYTVPWIEIAIASIAGMIGSYVASKYANKIPEKKMEKIIGITLILISSIMILQKIIPLL